MCAAARVIFLNVSCRGCLSAAVQNFSSLLFENLAHFLEILACLNVFMLLKFVTIVTIMNKYASRQNFPQTYAYSIYVLLVDLPNTVNSL